MKINDLVPSFTFHKNVTSRESVESGNPDTSNMAVDTVSLSRAALAIPTVHQANDSQGLEGIRSGEKNPDVEHQVDQAIDKANQFFQDDNRALQFIKDKDSDRIVIMIKDLKTDEVIRQIPSEAMLKLSKQLEQLQGILFEEKV